MVPRDIIPGIYIYIYNRSNHAVTTMVAVTVTFYDQCLSVKPREDQPF